MQRLFFTTIACIVMIWAEVAAAQSNAFVTRPAYYYSANQSANNAPVANRNATQRQAPYYVANNNQVPQNSSVIGSAGPVAVSSQGIGYMSSGGAPYVSTGPMGSSNGGGCSSCAGGTAGCSSCGGGGGTGQSGNGDYWQGSYFSSTCGMPQHMAYYPAMHGYYYFCPYHHTHVPYHQEFVGRFNIDPRNPYSNDFFKAIYAEYRASQREQGARAESISTPQPSGVIPGSIPITSPIR